MTVNFPIVLPSVMKARWGVHLDWRTWARNSVRQWKKKFEQIGVEKYCYECIEQRFRKYCTSSEFSQIEYERYLPELIIIFRLFLTQKHHAETTDR